MRAMLRYTVFGVAMLSLAIGSGSLRSWSLAAEEEGAESGPKHTIKEVMKIAHGKDSGILQKVLKGEASEDEKKQLLDVYIDMVEGTPTKGESDSWHVLAGNATLAAAKVVVGREGALEELQKATNCKACHSVHKGE
ncbi:MAG: hypothetical protein ABI557_13455 [Aureliella sp.]